MRISGGGKCVNELSEGVRDDASAKKTPIMIIQKTGHPQSGGAEAGKERENTLGKVELYKLQIIDPVL